MGFIMPRQWITWCIEYILSKLIDRYGERRWIRQMGSGMGSWDLIYYFECNLESMAQLPPPKKPLHFPAEIIVMVKEKRDYAGLNEFQWVNVFARHSGAKSYLMADTQFMAGPPFSQWQVTFVTAKALSEGRAKDRVLHSWKEEHKRCAWEMKWEKSSWFAHSTAAQLRVGYRPQPADLTVPDGDLTCFRRRFCLCRSRRALISFQSRHTSCLGF